jgi:hypothetical protein
MDNYAVERLAVSAITLGRSLAVNAVEVPVVFELRDRNFGDVLQQTV